jgi:hypothetical protein
MEKVCPWSLVSWWNFDKSDSKNRKKLTKLDERCWKFKKGKEWQIWSGAEGNRKYPKVNWIKLKN